MSNFAKIASFLEEGCDLHITKLSKLTQGEIATAEKEGRIICNSHVILVFPDPKDLDDDNLSNLDESLTNETNPPIIRLDITSDSSIETDWKNVRLNLNGTECVISEYTPDKYSSDWSSSPNPNDNECQHVVTGYDESTKPATVQVDEDNLSKLDNELGFEPSGVKVCIRTDDLGFKVGSVVDVFISDPSPLIRDSKEKMEILKLDGWKYIDEVCLSGKQYVFCLLDRNRSNEPPKCNIFHVGSLQLPGYEVAYDILDLSVAKLPEKREVESDVDFNERMYKLIDNNDFCSISKEDFLCWISGVSNGGTFIRKDLVAAMFDRFDSE